MKTTILLLVTILALLPLHTEAKPLSYVGGTMVMQENDETGHTLSMDYTFTPTEAFGIYMKQEENGKALGTPDGLASDVPRDKDRVHNAIRMSKRTATSTKSSHVA